MHEDRASIRRRVDVADREFDVVHTAVDEAPWHDDGHRTPVSRLDLGPKRQRAVDGQRNSGAAFAFDERADVERRPDVDAAGHADLEETRAVAGRVGGAAGPSDVDRYAHRGRRGGRGPPIAGGLATV